MWKKIFKIWNIVWGIIGGFGILVVLISGAYDLKDRFLPEESNLQNVKEYIFGTNFYYVQVLADHLNKVLAYGVTTRDKDFNPSFTILEGLYYISKDNILDRSKDKSGAKTIILGKTKFSDLGVPVDTFARLGAHDFYYHEEYYYGNPGNYQSYFFSANESGYLNVDNSNLSFFNSKNINTENQEVSEFRNNSIVNTIYFTAPGEGFDNLMLRKFLIGPDYYQIRVVPESSMPNVLDKNIEYGKLSKLSTNVDLENVIAILGRPLIVNDEPTFEVRTDLTLNERLTEESIINENSILESLSFVNRLKFKFLELKFKLLF